jgi:hypothetical protein
MKLSLEERKELLKMQQALIEKWLKQAAHMPMLNEVSEDTFESLKKDLERLDDTDVLN